MRTEPIKPEDMKPGDQVMINGWNDGEDETFIGLTPSGDVVTTLLSGIHAWDDARTWLKVVEPTPCKHCGLTPKDAA